MVGDTTVDVHAARRAGAWSVGVLCGFGQWAELARAGAHLVLQSTVDLRRWLI
jgi:phosphoglycolate phosphatase